MEFYYCINLTFHLSSRVIRFKKCIKVTQNNYTKNIRDAWKTWERLSPLAWFGCGKFAWSIYLF